MKDQGKKLVVIDGDIVWLHGLNPIKKQPNSATIHLVQRNKPIASKTVTAAQCWHWYFSAPKNADGKSPQYKLLADEISDYQTQQKGNKMVCIHKSVELDYLGEPTGRFVMKPDIGNGKCPVQVWADRSSFSRIVR